MTVNITDWESTARTELSQCANKQMALLNQMVEEALSSCQKDEDFLQLMQLFSKLAGGNAALADRASLNVDRLIRINNGRSLPVHSLRNPMLQLCWAVVKNQSALQPLLSYLGLEAEVVASEPVDQKKAAEVAEALAPSSESSVLPFDPATSLSLFLSGLPVRPANALRNERFLYLGQLVDYTEAELRRLPNVGRKSVDDIKQFLSDLYPGAMLGMKHSDLDRFLEKCPPACPREKR